MFHPWSSSSSSHPRFIESKVPQVISRVIHQSILTVAIAPCQQVLKRGIVSTYPIHAFALDPPSRSLKHFVQIVFRQPLLSSMSKIFVLGIQLPYSSPPDRFFFSKPGPSICSRIRVTSRFKLTVITAFFFNQFLLSFGIPARIGLGQRRDAVAQREDRVV
jgi:hypothetical protein